MEPIIGLTPSVTHDEKSYTIAVAHSDAILNAGAFPIILSYSEDEAIIHRMAETLDGLYVTGGYDIDPHYFNEEPHRALGLVNPIRDYFEIELVKQMIALNKPVLGVCRGCQIINVALGGTMYQDIFTQKKGNVIQHVQRRSLQYVSHFIRIEKDSLFFDITQMERIKVNSNHHQANRLLGENLRISAMSDDGIIEAIELTTTPFVLGVQWHPEQLLKRNDQVARALYHYFVRVARSSK